MRTLDGALLACLGILGAATAAAGEGAADTRGLPASRGGRSSSTPSPSTPADTEVTRALDAQLHVLDKTEALLHDKIAAREAALRARVQAAYKLLRTGSQAAWVSRDKRIVRARQRAGIRHILRRDIAELAIIRSELDHVQTSRTQLVEERRKAAELVLPEAGSLFNPVAFSELLEPFGNYRHDASGVVLSRRGIKLSSQPGRNVRAVAKGTVAFAGHVRGLGHTVLIDHGDFWSLSGHVTTDRLTSGDTVERGGIIGESIDTWVYVEIRMRAGAGGIPVDPVPLIDWKSSPGRAPH